jgi:hypothetical protein
MSERPRAITIRQPWAWAIVAGHKDVDNRSRRTNFRGELLIHAAVELDPRGFEFLWENGLYRKLPTELPRGGLIGMVNVVDCRKGYESDWAFAGSWHWILRRPREFKGMLPCRGHQGLFEPEVSARSIAGALRYSITHRQTRG